MPEPLYYSLYSWDVTDLYLAATPKGLCRIEFANQVTPNEFLARIPTKFQVKKDDQVFADLRKELNQYFNGQEVKWTMPLDILEGTDFQRLVWTYLLRIPYGQTTTYGQMAKELGKPGASRAVGAANGANPIPIVIPCHRVLAGNDKLGGYAGGLEVKQALLRIEGVLL